LSSFYNRGVAALRHLFRGKDIRMSWSLKDLLLVGLLCGSPAAIAQTGPPPGLDDCVESIRSTFDVPGIGLAIVRDGRVVLARGYGVRTLGKPGRVDGNTLFGIASNTKAFTATAIGLLVEEGKLEWDAPVIRYLPWFRLSDPYVTREVTVRDLLVHRSGLGLGAGDLLWWPASTYNRKEIAHRLSSIPLATSFRSAYAYDNVLYLVAGEVIEAVSGQSWEDFISKRILVPLGMQRTTVRHSAAGGGDNAAMPHARINGTVRPVEAFTSDNTNPAGGINSSAAEMARWLIVQLDSGRTAAGTRLFSPRTTRELWTLVTPIRIGDPPPALAALRPNFRGYGLGFDLHDYRGMKVVQHTGVLPGYVSEVTMIPELKLGVAVLTNQESGEAFSALTLTILDYYLGAPPVDWKEAFRRTASSRDSVIASSVHRASAKRDTASRLSLPLEKYAGTYEDPWYGGVEVRYANGGLTMRFGHTASLEGEMEHWQYDTFLVRWKDPELRADAFVTFSLNPDGSIERVRMKAASPETDFSFDFQDLVLTPAGKH
jgi:CubicO group peptidase (beta-lactamase class C family)